MTNVIVRAGERVTCPNGHELWEATRDVPRTQMHKYDCWRSVHHDLETPDRDVRMPFVCPDCERLVIKVGNGGLRMHFAEGWRP